jgi:hypothetical protein
MNCAFFNLLKHFSGGLEILGMLFHNINKKIGVKGDLVIFFKRFF